jgi:hypothetical protein
VTREALPIVGTTWYDRGPRYWLRRTGWALLMALVVAMVTAILLGFFSAMRRTSHTAFAVVLGIEVGYSMLLFGYLALQTARKWDNLEYVPPHRQRLASRRAAAGGAAMGILARSGSAAGALSLVVGSLVFIGLYAWLLVIALLPELPWERAARVQLQPRSARRG